MAVQPPILSNIDKKTEWEPIFELLEKNNIKAAKKYFVKNVMPEKTKFKLANAKTKKSTPAQSTKNGELESTILDILAEKMKADSKNIMSLFKKIIKTYPIVEHEEIYKKMAFANKRLLLLALTTPSSVSMFKAASDFINADKFLFIFTTDEKLLIAEDILKSVKAKNEKDLKALEQDGQLFFLHLFGDQAIAESFFHYKTEALLSYQTSKDKYATKMASTVENFLSTIKAPLDKNPKKVSLRSPAETPSVSKSSSLVEIPPLTKFPSLDVDLVFYALQGDFKNFSFEFQGVTFNKVAQLELISLLEDVLEKHTANTLNYLSIATTIMPALLTFTIPVMEYGRIHAVIEIFKKEKLDVDTYTAHFPLAEYHKQFPPSNPDVKDSKKESIDNNNSTEPSKEGSAKVSLSHYTSSEYQAENGSPTDNDISSAINSTEEGSTSVLSYNSSF